MYDHYSICTFQYIIIYFTYSNNAKKIFPLRLININNFMIQIKICILQEESNHEQLKSIIISRDSIISDSKLKAVRLQVQYFSYFQTIFANIENPVMEESLRVIFSTRQQPFSDLHAIGHYP